MLIPTVIDKTNNGECAYDIYSRLLDDRIIFITGEINDAVANTVIAQMLYLESKSAKAPISLYINSPGGVSQSGLAILDTMNYIKCPVSTICIGMAASMGAFNGGSDASKTADEINQLSNEIYKLETQRVEVSNYAVCMRWSNRG